MDLGENAVAKVQPPMALTVASYLPVGLILWDTLEEASGVVGFE